MPDREKVLKGLECLITDEVPCEGCQYNGSGYCLKNIAKDARELLKEQEPVRFRIFRASAGNYPFWDCVCDGCGFKTSTVHTNWKYCPVCGKPVKWDA